MLDTNRKAQSLVEFSITLPLLVVLLVAIIQFGLIFANYLTLSHAALVGARTASVTATTPAAAGEAAAEEAAAAFIRGTVTAVATPTIVGSNAAYSVTVTHDMDLIFPLFFTQNPYPLSATCVMRKE